MRQTHRPDYPLSTSTRLHAPSTILPAISFASGKPSSAKPEAALKRLPHRTFWNQTIEKRPGALGGERFTDKRQAPRDGCRVRRGEISRIVREPRTVTLFRSDHFRNRQLDFVPNGIIFYQLLMSYRSVSY